MTSLESSEEPPVAPVSSRAIDFTTGQYTFDAAGNFAAMPDLHQRIALLIAYHVRVPSLVGPSFGASVVAEVRRALIPLTRSRPPAVVIKDVGVEAGAGGARVTLRFADGLRLTVNANGATRT